jgi:hypothetical protein
MTRKTKIHFEYKFIRNHARNKIKGLEHLTLTERKNIYRDAFNRAMAEWISYHESKSASYKARHENKKADE